MFLIKGKNVFVLGKVDEINKIVLDYLKKKDKEFFLKYDLKENVLRFKCDMYNMYGKWIVILFIILLLFWLVVFLNYFCLIIKIRNIF